MPTFIEILRIRPVSKQRLFIHDLFFIDHFTVSGDIAVASIARYIETYWLLLTHYIKI